MRIPTRWLALCVLLETSTEPFDAFGGHNFDFPRILSSLVPKKPAKLSDAFSVQDWASSVTTLPTTQLPASSSTQLDTPQIDTPRRRNWRHHLHSHRSLIFGALLAALALLAWELLVRWQEYPAFILPSPLVVLRRLLQTLADGSLLRNALVTLREVVLGLVLGVGAGLLMGYWLGKNRTIETLVAPWLVASQSIPIVAIAPLLVIWFGTGLLSKVLVCALITFFPTLISTIVGLRSLDPNLRDLMRSLQADRWQRFTLLELPAALPIIFAGLKLSVILAVVGAVVGELMGANAGLGYMINLSRGVFDTPLLFVAIIGLVLIAQLLYLCVALLERRYTRWREVET